MLGGSTAYLIVHNYYCSADDGAPVVYHSNALLIVNT